jgi:O-succinylbenzoate synthase
LQAEFKTPICLDESIVSPRHARYALEMEACRIINIKPARVGWFEPGYCLFTIIAGAESACLVWRLCWKQGVGRASNLALASLPGFVLPGDISASDRYYDNDITNERFVLNDDSTIDVPRSHGLGVTIDEAALKQFYAF